MFGMINYFMSNHAISIDKIAYDSPYVVSETTEKKGVDISSWQNGIDFNLIKDNYEFVIIRGGFTGTRTGVNHYKDSSFEEFYQKTRDLNINTGVYYYSCANTYEKGMMEAKYLYENVLLGKQFEYPIFIDVEENKYQTVGKTLIADAIKGFCDYLKEKGYYAGVYANSNYFNNYIDTSSLASYEKWLAVWTNAKPEFRYGDYGIWQNSNNGYIGGYRVDTNYSYKDYPDFIKSNGLNGYEKPEIKNQESVQKIEETTIESIEPDISKQIEEIDDNQIENNSDNNKTIEDLANEVISGKWGNDEERKEKLEESGYNYYLVQSKVNEKYNIINSYTIKKGDTLYAIALKYYGDGNKYSLISDYNNIKNPNLIYAGDTIIIP